MAGVSEVHRLLQLQALDLEIEQIERQRSGFEEQIGETEELKAARSRSSEARQRLHEEETRVRERELDLASNADKLKQVQAKLYGGTVRIAKELGNLQRESEILAHAKSRSEDSLLESMSRVEDLQAGAQNASAAWSEAEVAWKASQEDLRHQIQELTEAASKIGENRARLASALSQKALEEYDRLRLLKRGVAVARVERNACMACRIGLPMSVVQQARSSPDFVYCPSCGRLLCADR